MDNKKNNKFSNAFNSISNGAKKAQDLAKKALPALENIVASKALGTKVTIGVTAFYLAANTKFVKNKAVAFFQKHFNDQEETTAWLEGVFNKSLPGTTEQGNAALAQSMADTLANITEEGLDAFFAEIRDKLTPMQLVDFIMTGLQFSYETTKAVAEKGVHKVNLSPRAKEFFGHMKGSGMVVIGGLKKAGTVAGSHIKNTATEVKNKIKNPKND